jgi:regulator of protease activity HflC (stomatin/prohibitin superfamily)
LTTSYGWVEKVPLVGVDGEPLKISGVVEAEVVQALLAANGIDCEVCQPTWRLQELPENLVLVPAERAEEAARIIAEARAEGEAAADEAELEGEAEGDLPPDDVDSSARGIL